MNGPSWPLRFGAALALLACLLPASASVPRAQEAGPTPELSEKRSQIDQLGRERNQTEQQLARIQASEAELKSEVEQLSELVRTSLRRKEGLELRIQRQKETIAEQAREQQRLEGEVRAGEKRIGLRLRRLYRMSKLGRSAMLFQMARFQSFPKDSHYLALMQEADREAIAGYEALGRELIDARQVSEASVQRLVALRAELDEESSQLAEREAYLRSAMGDIAHNRSLYRKYLADLERMVAGMEAAVTRMEQEAKAAAAAPPPRHKAPAELRGTLPVPVPGQVIATFGAQDPRYDLKKRQRGIVVRVSPSAPVAAVLAGRAVHAGPFRGYQSLVVIDHGEGLFSVYGHLEALTVKRGDWIVQGKVLGKATYQPVDEAYDVYFEIRHNGRPDDPLAWLQRGKLPIAAKAASNGAAEPN